MNDRPDSRHDYYARREAQERAQAERAGDPIARRVHGELATRYAEIAACAAEAAPAQNNA
ncbi:hypothetical protein GCM10009087_15300 [Sphingomonas oligophenolica]|uniref:Uncharacterized protein n=1 Tax=Sphingomonas oligophenolica TaxID=301154 RepID=A0ABU9Y303_9SPHN